MNFLAGVLLTWLPNEADAFAALSLLMRQRGLREMYAPDMSLLQVRLGWFFSAAAGLFVACCTGTC